MHRSPAAFTTIIGPTGPMKKIKVLMCMVTRLTTGTQWRRYGFSLLMEWSTILDWVLGVCYQLTGNCSMLKGSRDEGQ